MKNALLSVVSLFSVTSVLAQDFERIAPHLPETSPADQPDVLPKRKPSAPLAQADAVLVKKLRGVRLLSSTNEVSKKSPPNLQGVVVDPSVELISRNPRFMKELGDTFLDKALTGAKLELLRKEIISHYEDKGHPVVVVSVPPQDVTDGVLQLVVTEARVAEVRVEGNRYFKGERIASQVRLQPGDTIATGRLLADLSQLNQNPFRNVDVVFEPGAAPGTTNVILRTTDRRPFRVYAGYDDTGIDITGRDRWFAGFNWGNAFGADGVLSYQHTTSSDFTSSTAESLTYTQPLPWHHMATLFGSYGRVDAESLDEVESTGETFQLGLRYTIPLASKTGRFVHALVLGFDFKQTNNDLAFGGREVSSTKINVGQFMAGYNASYKTSKSTTSATLEGYYNPGNWVGNDSTADYQKLRADAKSSYAYLRGTLAHTQRLPRDFTATGTLTGQIASGNLVPTETMGVGGYGTVRGYDERIVNSDNALMASAELRTPATSLLQALGCKKANDQLQFLGFVDYGLVGNSKLQAGERGSEQLVSVGPGMRYTVGEWLSFRLDYGFALKKIDEGGDDGRVHIGAIISY